MFGNAWRRRGPFNGGRVAGIIRRSRAATIRTVDEVRGKVTQFDKAGAEAMDRVFGRGKYNAAA